MSPARPLVEHLAELRRHLGSRREVAAEVELPGLSVSSASVPEGAPVAVDLVLESIFGGAVTVSGQVRAPWVGECRRCLGEVRGELVGEVHEVFEPEPTEGETWPLHGDELDLEPLVREQVLLALPLAPLCRPDCPGPDPDHVPVTVEGEAEDEPAAPDPRWAALDQLRLGNDD